MTTYSGCCNLNTPHSHANAYAYYEARVTTVPKQDAWFHLMTILYQWGIVVFY